MVYAVLRVEFALEGAYSLKDKRQTVRSLIAKIRRAFPVAISEVEDLDLWNSAVVGVSAVSNSVTELESTMAKVRNVIDQFAEISDVVTELRTERW